MAYTFGAATTDKITLVPGNGIVASGRGAIWAGWFYPTALTAGRCLWGTGAVAAGGTRCAISATAGELDITVDRLTTDSVSTTTGCGLVANAWQFIAVAITGFDTGPVTTVKVWIGTTTESPRAVTITAPTGTGAIQVSTTQVIGNGSSAASLAFVGDIGNQFAVVSPTTGNLFGNTSGAIGAGAEETALNQIVIPFWKGEAVPTQWYNSQNTLNSAIDVWSVNMDSPSTVCVGTNILVPIVPTTVTGATFTENKTPFQIIGMQNMRSLVRR